MPIDAIGTPVTLPDGTPVPLSKAVRAGDFVLLSGQLAFGTNGSIVAGGIQAQTRQCLENAKQVLTDAGCSLSDVVKTTIWLTDPGDFTSFNSVYAEYFPTPAPARSAVCSALMVTGACVEIELLVFCPG